MTLQDKIREKFKEKIPSEVIEAYEFLIKSLNKGIKTAKDLLETVGKLLQKLGETVVEALNKLKLFNPEYCSALPKSDIDTNGLIEFKDENQKQLIGYIINEVSENIKEKQKEKDENLNEGKVGKTLAVGGGVALLSFAPGLALLAGGGYGLYKLLKYIGPKLSDKLEPYLLNDKTKEFANKLYNNKFARYSLGLSKNKDDDKSESKLKNIGKILWSVIVNLVIATLVSTLLTVFVTTLIGTCPATGLIIATIIGSKNIFKIIINRVLNFKKETETKNGDTKVNYFFDMTTMIGILSSVVSIVIKIPGFNEWLGKVFGKIFDFGTMKASAQNFDKFKIDKSMLDARAGDELDNLGNFEFVKKLLNMGEKLENPVINSSNDQISSFTQSLSNNGSEKVIDAITSLTKSSEAEILMSAAQNEINDGVRTSLLHMFTTSSYNIDLINGDLTNTCKEFVVQFTQLNDSTIGFSMQSSLINNGTDSFEGITGIFSAAGKILKIEGINGVDVKGLIGKTYDDLIKLIVK